MADQASGWVEHRGATARLRRTGSGLATVGLTTLIVSVLGSAGVTAWAVTTDLSWISVVLATAVVVLAGLVAIAASVPVSAWLEGRRFGCRIDLLSLSLVRYRDGQPGSGRGLRDHIHRLADDGSDIVGGRASTLVLRDTFYFHPSSGRRMVCGHTQGCNPATPDCLRTIYEPQNAE